MILFLALESDSAALAGLVVVKLTFHLLSGFNHLVSEVKRGGKNAVHYWRLGGSILLVGFCIPVLARWNQL